MIVQTKRSLKASSVGILRANKAILSFASKVDLAAELEISGDTVQNFFTGKPIGRENFHKICKKLKLPLQEIAELPEETKLQLQWATHNDCNVDTLITQLRNKGQASIYQKCGVMRLLGMSHPIGLNDIYTNVNILEKISGRRRLEVAELLKIYVSDDFERPGLGRISEDRVLGLEAVKQHSKLMVLGKPGAGKTTFLKHIAMQCSLGEFQSNRVPLFITLKDFAETEQQPSLLKYISGEFATYGVTDSAVTEQLLNHGKALVLLDGLDEVRKTDEERVLQEIRNFAAKFHDNNFVITCRIAARDYILEEFTEVEVADFDDEQIATFATKWFVDKDPIKGKKIIKKLKENHPIRELATSPLLLTLVCLMFEELAEFPSNRTELYKEGLDILLKKWDGKRNIEREQAYKKLSLQQKEDLLSQIARITFERGEYFFSQKEVEQQIADYICNLTINTNIELQLDSEAVLKSLEAQHGLLVERAREIYSFSHLTFQEYFTAKEIVTTSSPQALEMALKQLVTRITEKRWREVFLLTTSMLPKADYLLQLIKRQIDDLIVHDKHLQNFLTWLTQKSRAVTVPYKVVAVRAFYLDLSLGLDLKLNPALSLALKLDPALGLALKFDLELDLELDFALSLARTLDCTLARALDCTLARALDRELQREAKLSPLGESLQHLKEQLPDPDEDEESFKKWWKAKGGAWVEQLRAVQIKYRNIGYNWHFSVQQTQALQQYHDANKLLVDCLQSACYTTRAVREEILETLLLPNTSELYG